MFAGKTAVAYGTRRYTYRQFEERVHRLASALRAKGLRKGDRVAFIAPNIPPLLEAHFAVPMAGGVLVAVNLRLSAADVQYILRHSGARFVFVDRESAPLVAGFAGEASIVTIADSGAADDPYEVFLDHGSPDPLVSWLEHEQEMITLNYTSGTTGTPKGVM